MRVSDGGEVVVLDIKQNTRQANSGWYGWTEITRSGGSEFIV